MRAVTQDAPRPGPRADSCQDTRARAGTSPGRSLCPEGVWLGGARVTRGGDSVRRVTRSPVRSRRRRGLAQCPPPGLSSSRWVWSCFPVASHLCLLHQAPIALPSGTCAKRQKVRVRADTLTRSAGAGHPDGARPRESRASRCLSLRREPKDTRGVFNGNTKSNKLPLAHSFFFLKQA